MGKEGCKVLASYLIEMFFFISRMYGVPWLHPSLPAFSQKLSIKKSWSVPGFQKCFHRNQVIWRLFCTDGTSPEHTREQRVPRWDHVRVFQRSRTLHCCASKEKIHSVEEFYCSVLLNICHGQTVHKLVIFVLKLSLFFVLFCFVFFCLVLHILAN